MSEEILSRIVMKSFGLWRTMKIALEPFLILNPALARELRFYVLNFSFLLFPRDIVASRATVASLSHPFGQNDLL
jgi:hypothetical protein